MKLKLLAFAVLALVFSSTNAQETEFYIKGGFNLANVSVTSDGGVDDAKAIASFHAGVMADFPLTSFLALQPSLIFTGKGSKLQTGNTSDVSYFRATSKPYYIELPVNLIFKLPLQSEESSFFVGAGPYVAMGIAGKNKAEGKIFSIPFSSDEKIEFSNEEPTTGSGNAGLSIMRRLDYGVNATAGLVLGNVLVSVNYGLGLAKLQAGSDNSDGNDNKHRVLGLSLGFRL